MFKQNLNNTDRILRFILAFWWLGPFAPNFTSILANQLVYVVGWIAFIESFIGWCWLQETLGIRNK